MKAPKIYNRTNTSLDTIIDSFFDRGFSPFRRRNHNYPVDIKEKEDAYLLELNIPGVEREDITVEIEEDILNIEVNYNQEKDDQWSYVRQESPQGEYSYSYRINNIKENDIEANYENGVLSVYMPKKTVDNQKKIIDIN